MLTGIYRATMGMRAGLAVQDVIAHNLANVSTAGYKRRIPVYEDIAAAALQSEAPPRTPPAPVRPAELIIRDGVAEVTLSATGVAAPTDRSQGEARYTGQKMDLCIQGPGFFVLEGPGGQRIYTRSGHFYRGPDGDLTSLQGFRVLDDRERPINVDGGEITVTEEGDVAVDGQIRGRLLIADLASGEGMQPVEGGFISQGPPVPASGYVVRQGYLETSNVNPVQEMVAMISCMRAYEAAQRAISAADAALGKAVNEVGRLS
ncbi:MAG: flagellar basal-body rod protein FlgF [Armatimonadota bacterium]|nr:MAG: flagellar basal-body rod protein FlgF [Armatimonadota bacterium]